MRLLIALLAVLTVWPSVPLQTLEALKAPHASVRLVQQPTDFFALCLNDFSNKYNSFVRSYNQGKLIYSKLREADAQWRACVDRRY